MNRLSMTMLLAMGLPAAAAPAAASMQTAVPQQLLDALLCVGNPIDRVHALAEDGSDFAQGYAVAGFGEGTGYTVVVALQHALAIGGATAQTVVAEVESSNFEFAGIVYAQFAGDYHAVVEQLGLHPASNAEVMIGKFERSTATDLDGNADRLCPKTIALTPLEDGGFLLGCGWCNG